MVFGWMTVAHKQKSFPVLSKQGGGVIMTLLVSLFLKQGGADGGNTPALFLASGQRASGVHERPNRGPIKGPFLLDSKS